MLTFLREYWVRGILRLTQRKLVVLMNISMQKNLKDQLIPSRDFVDQRILKHKCPPLARSVSLRFCFPLMIISTQKKLRYRLILSIDIDDKRIGTSGYTQAKTVVSDSTFLLYPSTFKKFKSSIYFFQSINDQKILQSD